MAERSHRRRGPKRGWWMALLFGVVLSVVLAEVLAYVYISISGVTVPLLEGREFTGEFEDHTAAYTHTYTLVAESERLVCGEEQAESPYRLAVLGDSFGYGVGVADCEDFSSIVNLGLPDVKVRNVSQVAAGMNQYLEILDDRVCGADFDGIFLLLCGNDFLDSPESLLAVMSRRSNVAGLAYTLLGRPPPNNWAVRFFARFGLVEHPAPGTPLKLTWWQKTVRPPVGDRRVLVTLLDDLSTSREFALHLSNPPLALAERNVELFNDLLDRAADCSKEVWVAVVPNGAAYSPKQREFIASFGGVLPPEGRTGLVQKLVQEAAASHGARYVETDSVFAQEADAAYYANDIHWTVRGHQIMAGRVFQALTERSGAAAH
jgi:hypothetical protein